MRHRVAVDMISVHVPSRQSNDEHNLGMMHKVWDNTESPSLLAEHDMPKQRPCCSEPDCWDKR